MAKVPMQFFHPPVRWRDGLRVVFLFVRPAAGDVQPVVMEQVGHRRNMPRSRVAMSTLSTNGKPQRTKGVL